MVNPFKFGLEVSGEQFYDRSETAEKLYRRLSGGSSNVKHDGKTYFVGDPFFAKFISRAAASIG